jgi:hypothetical protein
MTMEASRDFELLQELQALRLLAEQQVQLLQAILEAQGRIEEEIRRAGL